MKMKTLTALWLCLALTFQLKAQKESSPQDSIYIEPFSGCKIILVGGDIKEIVAKNNLEVLKNKFIHDFKQSAAEKDFPAQAKNIVYMTDRDGRRRLKAIPEENITFNLKNEIKDFKNNFPAYHYIIYDFPSTFSYHIYVSNPADLDQLDTINCQKIFTDIATKKYNEPRRYSTIMIGRSDTGFVIKSKDRFRTDFLELSFMGGVSLINGSFAPTFSGSIDFVTGKTYRQQKFKAGIGYSFYTFGQLENRSFTNFYPIISREVHVLFNVNPSDNKNSKWLGLNVGKFGSGSLFKSSSDNSKGSLENAYKVGIVSQFGSFGVDYNFIFDKNKNTSTGITFKYYF